VKGRKKESATCICRIDETYFPTYYQSKSKTHATNVKTINKNNISDRRIEIQFASTSGEEVWDSRGDFVTLEKVGSFLK
jgi:hypothetical protein